MAESRMVRMEGKRNACRRPAQREGFSGARRLGGLLLRRTLAAAPALIAGWAAGWLAAAEAPKPAAEAALSRVLYLGDSHSLGPFGERLDAALRGDGLEVHTYATGAGSPYSWLTKSAPITASLGAWEKTPAHERKEEVATAIPKLESLLRGCRPQVVIVQSGGELAPALLAGTPEARARVRSVVAEFCEAISRAGAWIYWIEPPDAHPKRLPPETREGLSAIVREMVGACQGRAFDSAAVTTWTLRYPGPSDGLHFEAAEAQKWADAVLADLRPYLKSVAGRKAPAMARTRLAPTPGVAGNRDISPPPPPGPVPPVRSLDQPDASEELQVQLVLRRKSAIENPAQVEGGTAFGVFEYEVGKVYAGTYSHNRLRVAHVLLLNGQATAPNRFEPGREYYLALVRMAKYPALSQLPLVTQLEADSALPVYICRF